MLPTQGYQRLPTERCVMKVTGVSYVHRASFCDPTRNTRSVVLAAVLLNIWVLRDLALCRWASSTWRFEHHLHCPQDRQCTCNVTMRSARESLLPWKSNKYYMCVCVCVRARGHAGTYARVALLSSMQRVCTMSSFVASLAPQHFSKFSHKRHEFREKGTEHKTCVLIFSATFI
jgi:hypothetical protein